MNIPAREQVKSLLAIRGTTLTELADTISKNSGKVCSPSALSNKLSRGTITYNEVMNIAEILGFSVRYDMK